MCETAKLSPVPCGVRVAKEADLDSSLALAPAGFRVLGKCLLLFLEPQASHLEIGNTTNSDACS